MNRFIEIRTITLKPGTREDTRRGLKSAASPLKPAKTDSSAVYKTASALNQWDLSPGDQE